MRTSETQARIESLRARRADLRTEISDMHAALGPCHEVDALHDEYHRVGYELAAEVAK